MLTVSNNIKNAYNQYTTQRKSKIKVGNTEYFIQNMDLYADAYDEGNIVGNTIAKTLKFDIETQYVRGLDEFELYDGIWTGEEYEYINLGTFKLFEEQGTDDFFSSVTAYDKLIFFNAVFDPSLVEYPTTVYGLLEDICEQAGVTLATSSIANGTQPLSENLFVEGETLKDILKAICQISGTFAVISNDTLKLKLQGSDTLTLSKYQLVNPQYKRTTWKVNQIVLGMQDVTGEYVQKQDDEDVELNGAHKIVINNNPFVYTQGLRQAYIDELFDAVKGFGYVAYETDWEGLPYVELGDSLVIDGYESLVLRYELRSPNGLKSMLQAPSIIDSVIDYVNNTNDLENKMRKTEYTVNKATGTITQLTEEVGEYDDRITTVEQDVDTIRQTAISYEDLKRNVKSVSMLHIQDAVPNYPLKFSIKNASVLFPKTNLYPSNNTIPEYQRLVLIVDKTQILSDEAKIIELPVKNLYAQNNVYDEFVVEKNRAKLIHRLILNQGEVVPLQQEFVEDLGEVNIELFEGDNYIYLYSLTNDGAIYEIDYTIPSEFTDMFATEVYVNSSIEQTANQILLQVNEKVDEEEIIAKLNVAVEDGQGIVELKGNSVIIESDNFTLDADGKIDATAGDIAGFEIDGIDGFVYKIYAPYDYTNDDLLRIQGILTQEITPTEEDYTKYDLNNNGIIDATDYIRVYYYFREGITTYTNGKFEISLPRENKLISARTGYINAYDELVSGFSYNDMISENLKLKSEGNTTISATGSTGNITCVSLTQTSKEESKKNFEKLNNAKEILKATDIYKYNLKNEEDSDKKHIGLVIGDKYNYSEEITSKDNDGVDIYSMVSVLWQAVKEQQSEIDKLKKLIKESDK